jgi:hypothetical protein
VGGAWLALHATLRGVRGGGDRRMPLAFAGVRVARAALGQRAAYHRRGGGTRPGLPHHRGHSPGGAGREELFARPELCVHDD